jgi:hypothetical protein
VILIGQRILAEKNPLTRAEKKSTHQIELNTPIIVCKKSCKVLVRARIKLCTMQFGNRTFVLLVDAVATVCCGVPTHCSSNDASIKRCYVGRGYSLFVKSALDVINIRVTSITLCGRGSHVFVVVMVPFHSGRCSQIAVIDVLFIR